MGRILDRARAEQSAPTFDRWTKWAAERNAEFGLGDRPKGVSDTFWALLADVEKDPIDWEGRSWTATQIRNLMRGYFTDAAAATDTFVGIKTAAEDRTSPSGPSATVPQKLPGGSADEAFGSGGSEPEPPTTTAWP